MSYKKNMSNCKDGLDWYVDLKNRKRETKGKKNNLKNVSGKKKEDVERVTTRSTTAKADETIKQPQLNTDTSKKDELNSRLINEREKKQNNVIIRNWEIPSCGPDEMSAAVNHLFKKQLGLKNVKAVSTSFQRNPCSRYRGPTPILVKLKDLEDKEAVFKHARKLKGTGVNIQNDLSQVDRATHSKLYEHMKNARKAGKRAFLNEITMTLKIDGVSFKLDENGNDIVPI